MSLTDAVATRSNLTMPTQICVLDEPSNFLDREALGGLAVAIRDWAGAVVSVSYSYNPTLVFRAFSRCLDASRLLFLTTRSLSLRYVSEGSCVPTANRRVH